MPPVTNLAKKWTVFNKVRLRTVIREGVLTALFLSLLA